jgi:hypothetical protein
LEDLHQDGEVTAGTLTHMMEGILKIKHKLSKKCRMFLEELGS